MTAETKTLSWHIPTENQKQPSSNSEYWKSPDLIERFNGVENTTTDSTVKPGATLCPENDTVGNATVTTFLC